MDNEAFILPVPNTFHTWAVEKCSPLVREITFENAEELTEEGLPFLILFHHPDDHDSVKAYTELVTRVNIHRIITHQRVKLSTPGIDDREVQCELSDR